MTPPPTTAPGRTAAAALAVVASVGLLGGLSGCSGSSDAAAPPSTSSTGPATTGEPGSPTAPPTRPDVAFTAPAGTSLGAGERVWAAFSDHTLEYPAWWARLKPLLSPAAQATYVYDDPRNLPEIRTTGPLTVSKKAPDDPRFTARVVVPTDHGTFGLDLERHTHGAPWLLYAIDFPKNVS